MKLGPYEILDELGRGGMGAVFRARHVSLGAIRALKLLDGVPDAEGLERFRREAQALARLDGKGVVPVHDSGEASHRFYFAMELMPGGSLRDRLKRDGRLDWREAAGIGAKLARTLARCHELDLVHRDVKPDNVLFDDAGEPRIGDFGCVRDLGRSALTMSGASPGTPGYMAPEQLNGERAGKPADVFALGVIVHELVTGERPYPATTPVLLYEAALAGKRARPSAVVGSPAVLDRILDAALAPEPSKRITASRLALELEALALGKVALEPRSALVPALVGLVLALSVLGAVVASVRAGSGHAATPTPTPVAPPSSPPKTTPTPTPSPLDPALVMQEQEVEAFADAVGSDEARAVESARHAREVMKTLLALKKNDGLYHKALEALSEAVSRLVFRIWVNSTFIRYDENAKAGFDALAIAAEPCVGDDLVLRAAFHLLRTKPWSSLAPDERDDGLTDARKRVLNAQRVAAFDEECAAVEKSARRSALFLNAVRFCAIDCRVRPFPTPETLESKLALLNGADELCTTALSDPIFEKPTEDRFQHMLARELFLRRGQIAGALADRGGEPSLVLHDLERECEAYANVRRFAEREGDQWTNDTRTAAKLELQTASRASTFGDSKAMDRHLDAAKALVDELGARSWDALVIEVGIAHLRGKPEERDKLRDRLLRAEVEIGPHPRHPDADRFLYPMLLAHALLEVDSDRLDAARELLERADAYCPTVRGIPQDLGLCYEDIARALAAKPSPGR